MWIRLVASVYMCLYKCSEWLHKSVFSGFRALLDPEILHICRAYCLHLGYLHTQMYSVWRFQVGPNLNIKLFMEHWFWKYFLNDLKVQPHEHSATLDTSELICWVWNGCHASSIGSCSKSFQWMGGEKTVTLESLDVWTFHTFSRCWCLKPFGIIWET